jgi:hypothetical protein
MKVVRLYATAAFTPQEILIVLISVRYQCHSAARRNMSIRKFNDTTGNRTHDLPACSTVPQPTAPPCGASAHVQAMKIHEIKCYHFVVETLTLIIVVPISGFNGCF